MLYVLTFHHDYRLGNLILANNPAKQNAIQTLRVILVGQEFYPVLWMEFWNNKCVTEL